MTFLGNDRFFTRTNVERRKLFENVKIRNAFLLSGTRSKSHFKTGTCRGARGRGLGARPHILRVPPSPDTKNVSERDRPFLTKNTKNGTEWNVDGTIGKRKNDDGTI